MAQKAKIFNHNQREEDYTHIYCIYTSDACSFYMLIGVVRIIRTKMYIWTSAQ